MAGNSENQPLAASLPYHAAISENQSTDERHHAPAAMRNLEPITGVLKNHLSASGLALEIASGSGQHAAAFAGSFPGIEWQPSDPVPDARKSIAAWRVQSGLGNIQPPLALDMMDADWHTDLETTFDAIIAINMLHISPWEATCGLMRGTGILLGAEGFLYVYGPFMREGKHTAESNASFDVWLKDNNADWGVRDIADVAAEAETCGLKLADIIPMPANNFSLVFRH